MPSEFCLPAEAAGFLVDFEQAKGRMLWVKFIEAVLADIVIPAAHGGDDFKTAQRMATMPPT